MSLRGVLDFRNLPNDPARAAATGAAAGAVYGSVVPGIGTAAGAAIGAVVGAITGAVNAKRIRTKAKRDARDAFMVEQNNAAIAKANAQWQAASAGALQRQAALVGQLRLVDLRVTQVLPAMIAALGRPVAIDLAARRDEIMDRRRALGAAIMAVPVPTLSGGITVAQVQAASSGATRAATAAVEALDWLQLDVNQLLGDAQALVTAAQGALAQQRAGLRGWS